MIKLLISDCDQEYGAALGRAISNLHKEIEVTVVEAGGQRQNAHRSFDWVLIGDEQQLPVADERQESWENALLRVLLTEFPTAPLEEQKENKQEDMPFMVYKYDSVSEIVSALYFLHHLLRGKGEGKRSYGESKMLAFYSPIGGTGTTSIAISTGRELCQFHHKRVLYLTFADFFHPAFYFSGYSGERNLSDYLYYALEKKDPELTHAFNLFCSSDDYGLQTFALAKGRNELADLSLDALHTFLDGLLCGGYFDYFLLDLPKQLSATTFYLLERAAALVLVFDRSPPSRVYQETLAVHLEKLGVSCPQKIITVHNRMPVDVTQRQQGVCADIEIEEDPQSFLWTDQSVSISINHLFGLGVKKIGEKLLDTEK